MVEKKHNKPATEGVRARQRFLRPGETFYTNMSEDGFERDGKQVTPDDYVEGLKHSGRFEEVRVIDQAFDKDGRRIEDSVAVVVKRKTD